MCLLAKKRKGLKSFLAESREKNRNYLFYPSAKSRRELKIKTLGVTFRGASAYYVQKSIAPQKQAVCRFSDEFFFAKIFIKKFCQNFVFDVQKWNVGNRLKRIFPKFEAERSHIRGVNGHSKFGIFFGFRRRKMKCRESSETRFPKVSRRTEPSSGGKRPFKVCNFFFGVEKWNVGNPLKRVLAKFRADRSHVRGANGWSKK